MVSGDLAFCLGERDDGPASELIAVAAHLDGRVGDVG
jgi:hypothetical protein